MSTLSGACVLCVPGWRLMGCPVLEFELTLGARQHDVGGLVQQGSHPPVTAFPYAADVPITHTFGRNTLLSFKVWTDEVS